MISHGLNMARRRKRERRYSICIKADDPDLLQRHYDRPEQLRRLRHPVLRGRPKDHLQADRHAGNGDL